MVEDTLCTKCGKTAGNTVRIMMNFMKHTDKWKEGIKKVVDTLVTGTARCCKETGHKVGNLFKTVKSDSSMAKWEIAMEDTYIQLGKEIFSKIEKEGLNTNALEDEKVKELLKRVKEYEKQLETIKEQSTRQKQKMDNLMIIKQARHNLKSEDPRVRRVAIRVLERVGTKEVIPIVTEALKDTDEDVRLKAAEVMHKLIDKSLDDTKVESLKEKSESIATETIIKTEEYKNNTNNQSTEQKNNSESSTTDNVIKTEENKGDTNNQ